MDDPTVLEQMRSDWNHRAGEDANYYVAFGRRDQDEEEFFATGSEMAAALALELKRFPGRDAALEIGCGPGRLMRPMSRYFTEIHGIDVSDRMIALARERLRGTPNAHPRHASGSDLRQFPDERFDFVYSYAVFQHIPSRDVVFNYLREAHRVLKPGGVLRCQLNGLPAHARHYDTWSGVRIAPQELLDFTRDSGLQLLALEQIWTQYMWITCRKPGVFPATRGPARIRSISNALTGEAVAPASGPMAALSLWVENLPAACGLNDTEITAGGLPCRLTYIGEPAADGVAQVNAFLPEGLRTGLVEVVLSWRGQPLCPPAWVRIMPAGPAVPRLTTVADGVNLLSGNRIVSRSVKATIIELPDPGQFRAVVDGVEAADVDAFCADPIGGRFEFNFRLPDSIAAGAHHVEIAIGRRTLAVVPIEVA